MTTGLDWQEQTGRSWAEMYRYTDRSFAPLTSELLGLISEFDGEAILDIGCGAGELTLAVARARPQARVIGLDVSADLLEVARARAADHPAAEFRQGDAASWQAEAFAPDLLISRHGVMFFDDPVSAFRHLAGQSAPAAHLVFSCFRTPRENPWMSELAAMLPLDPDAPAPDPEAPGPFAFANPQRVEAILAEAGWGDIDIAPFDYAYVAGAGEDPVGDALAFLQRIGPAARRLHELDGPVRDTVLADIRAWLTPHCADGLVAFPAAAWLVTARIG